jgi:hypothetical protein
MLFNLRNGRGTNTFTNGLLQIDLAFVIRRKCPFKSTKTYTKEKCRSRSLSHRRKNQARRTTGPPAMSENPQPRSPAANTPEDPAGYEIRLSVGFGRISQRDLPRNRDLVVRWIRPDLVRSRRAWDFAKSGEIRLCVGFGWISLKPTPAESGFRPKLSDLAGTHKPTPAERGFLAGSGQKSGGRTGERGERDIVGDGETRAGFNQKRIFLSIYFE